MDWTTIIVAIIGALGAGIVPVVTMRHKLLEQKRQFDADANEREIKRRERMDDEMRDIRKEMREEIGELRNRLNDANTEIVDLRRRLTDCESKHSDQINESAALRAELSIIKAKAGIEDRRQ